jgi:serine/threonine-protein kinase
MPFSERETMARQIGKYEILRTLGQGAMGEVYLAHHPAIGREVAIKTILPNVAKGEDAEGRFRREAEAAGKLNHPNLVTIFDFDKDPAQGLLFLVMEFVKGDDLEDLIREKALSPRQYLEVLAQVCDGLGHAHRNHVIHRDIKPSNVRVMRDGMNLQAKVMDFGIARSADSNMTATGIVMGTVNYMAPEYIREGRATAQSDLFAVGVVLYECLTGRKPFAGETTTTILFKIVSDAPAAVEVEAINGISPGIRDVLDKALAKDPANRFQTAEDLAKALRACKDPTWSGVPDEATSRLVRPGATLGLPAAPTRMERLPVPGPTGGVAPGAAPRHRTWLYAGAAVLLLAGGGAFLARRPGAKAPVPVQTAVPAGAVATPFQPAATPVQAAGGAPVQAGPGTDGRAPVRAAAAPAPARPAPVSATPAPAKAPLAPTPAATAPPVPANPPPDKPPEDPLKTIGKVIDSDPQQAVALLKPMALAQPGSATVQGNYLAALYRSRNAQDFDRALTRATAAGVTVKVMLGVPAFRAAMADESRLQKTRPPSGVLSPEVMDKVVEGL